MLSVTREKLLSHLCELSGIVDSFAKRDVYVQGVLAWMSRVEQTLQQVRSPMASAMAAERGRILAVADGLRDPEIAEAGSVRKAERATTALALSRVESILRSRVDMIDQQLEMMREKMTSFLAAASVDVPIPLPPTEPRVLWLQKVWGVLGHHPGTGALFAYLNASLTRHDRMYLLDQILEDLLSGPASSAAVADTDRK